MATMRRYAAVLVLAVATFVPAQRAFAHPLHSTLTELTEDRSRGVVRATIRVFAEDFGTSLARFARTTGAPMSPQWNAAALGYVTSAFTIGGKSAAPSALRSCGITRTADLLWICVETVAPGGLAGLQVRNAMLCDLFEDQVNVVQATIGGAKHSLLFTRGDRSKPIG